MQIFDIVFNFLATILKLILSTFSATLRWFSNSKSTQLNHNMNMCLLGEECSVKIESHEAATPDGYFLTLHRLTVSAGGASIAGKLRNLQSTSNELKAIIKSTYSPVLIIHGLLQDSESFLCGYTDGSLASMLTHAGYDVWLGNNRGTKYSSRHANFSTKSSEFWNFSLDELSQYDVPTLIHYILATTGHKKLCVVGFSQGSAQVFGALSMDRTLCDKINIFIALSSPIRPIGISNKYFEALAKWDPFLPSYLYGNAEMFSNVPRIQSILNPTIFSTAACIFVWVMFGWKCKNLNPKQRPHLFKHSFSPSSVKCIIQWFQMIKLKCLGKFIPRDGKQMGDEYSEQQYTRYDYSHISTPIASIAGEIDGFIDPHAIPELVPNCVFSHVEPDYEHLDIIWADDAKEKIFPLIGQLLDTYTRL